MSLFYGQVTALNTAKSLALPTGTVISASAARPIVITSTAHGLADGDWVSISGNVACNGRHQVKRLTDDTFSLSGSTGSSVVIGGTWRKFWRDAIVLLQAESQDVRWRDDGVAPTSALGMVLHADESPTVYRGDMVRLSLIETTATAKVNFTIMREGAH